MSNPNPSLALVGRFVDAIERGDDKNLQEELGDLLLNVVMHAQMADERGAFARTYDEETFAVAGLPTHWPQCNTSFNRTRGTLREM